MFTLADLTQASALAADWHKAQRRYGPAQEPYINHCLRVQDLLAACGVHDLFTLMLAVLHDTVEDTDATVDDIRRPFGDPLAISVEHLSAPADMPMRERKRWQAEKAPQMTRSEKLVKEADQTDNLRSMLMDPPGWPASRCLEYADLARAIVDGCRGLNDQLDHIFDEMYAAVHTHYRPGTCVS